MKKSKQYKKLAAIILSVAMALSLGSCSSSGGEAASNGPKDSIVIGATGEPSSLDSADANDLTTFSVQSNLYDGLIREESDGSLVPGLAESWEYNDDRTEITFTLREGVKFHNGETMTADDVVFSFERAMESPSTTRITASMNKMEKVDDTHVKLTLNYSYGPIEECLANVNCSIVSKAAVEADPEGFARNPVGTGPYKFVSWDSGSKISFEAFEDYFRGPASIKKLDYQIISDTSAALIALETGDVDLLMSTQAADRENIMNNEDLFYTEVSSAGPFFVVFNNSEGIFAENPLLRQAVAHAINRDDCLLGAAEGVGAVCTSPIPAGCFGCPENYEGITYDPELSKQLLAEAGYGDGLTITIRTMESGTYSKTAEVVVEQLRQVGITAEVELMERTAFLSDVYTNCDYEICVNSYTALAPDADFIMYMRYHSDYLGGGNNFAMVNDPQLDEYLDIGRFSSDEAEREQAYLDACELMAEQAYVVPILCTMNGVACRANLKGVTANISQKQYVYDYYWE